MAEPRKDKELPSDTKGKEKEDTQSDSKAADADKSSSNTSSNASEDAKKCMDAVEFFNLKAKDLVIGKPKKSETKKRKSRRKVSKIRKRAPGGLKKSISLRSGLNEIGMSYDDSDSEPTYADVVAKWELNFKGKEQGETDDVFHGSDTDEACKRMKKGPDTDDDDDSNDDGAGAGTGSHPSFPSTPGFEVAGK